MDWKKFYKAHNKKIIGVPIIALILPLVLDPSYATSGWSIYFSKVFWSGLHAALIWTGADYINAYGIKKYPSFHQTKQRLMLMALAVTIVVTVVVLIIVGLFFLAGNECGFSMVIEDFKISFIVTTMVVSWEEAIYLFSKWKEAIVETERLQKQTVVAHYETLKNQVNPHFLFNSLNTLTSLIHQDPVKAEQFTEEFAKVYRYLLEMKDQTVVPLKEEIDFVQSYLFLQKKRYGDSLTVTIKVSADSLLLFIPPVSLQLLVENAIKHNIISGKKPLHITISDDDHVLVVKNNLQIRNDYEQDSTGVGLKNLKDKYGIIAEVAPTFQIENNEYIAKIPLIPTED